MKTKVGMGAALMCALACMLLTSGCKTARGWSSTIKQTLRKLHEEDEFKKQKLTETALLRQLKIPHDKLAVINPQYMVVDATNHLDRPFVACRHRFELGDGTRIIYIDPDVTYDDTLTPDPGHENEIKVKIEVGDKSETFHLEKRHYIWLKFPEKHTELAVTKKE